MTLPRILVRVVLVSAVATALRAQCAPEWSSAFGYPGPNFTVVSMAPFDDGTGIALHMTGAFTSVGNLPVPGAARWNGAAWSSSFAGSSGAQVVLRTRAVFDAGSGPVTWFAGTFPTGPGGTAESRVARWTGSQWAFLGGGFDGTIRALKVFDSGAGPILYAAGSFLHAGGVPASLIARWKGGSWQPVDAGLGSSVYALPSPYVQVSSLAVYDDGSGPALIVGGQFDLAGGIAVHGLARWNGSSWSPLPRPDNVPALINVLTVFDEGAGPVLFVLGRGGFSRLSGTDWQTYSSFAPYLILDSLVFDDGAGPALYASGDYIPGTLQYGVFRWTGSSWTGVGLPFRIAGSDEVWIHSLAAYDDGTGAKLYCGGYFTHIGSALISYAARWDGQAWSALGDLPGGLGGYGNRAVAYDDGSGPDLLVSGWGTLYDGPGGFRRWNGSAWSDFPLPLQSVPGVHAVLDDGNGPALYAAAASSTVPLSVVRWNGSSWNTLGGSFAGVGSGPTGISALAFHDDGSGPALYAAGTFASAGGVPARSIARFDGTAWQPVGAGFSATFPAGTFPGEVTSLSVHDDGSGAALYAAGMFRASGALPLQHVARWDGVAWSDVGGGFAKPSPYLPRVNALASCARDPLAGLYAGGEFSTAGQQPRQNLASWDGAAWRDVGGGIPGLILALTPFDDGEGIALFAGGSFGTQGGAPGNGIARWNGTQWSALGNGLRFGDVRALAGFHEDTRSSLFAAGGFRTAGSFDSRNVAEWYLERPAMQLSQPGGWGAPVLVSDMGLAPGHEYLAVFSVEPCFAGPGNGPWLGLCASDPMTLLAQALLPVGAEPFHFVAQAQARAFGPYPLPVGLAVDGLLLDISGGALQCRSVVRSFEVR